MGTLTDIAEKVKEAGIRKTALVTVGRFLGIPLNFPNYMMRILRRNSARGV